MSTGQKQDVEILSQHIDDEVAHYRVRIGQGVRYLKLPVEGVFDDGTLCRPHLLIPNLPNLPDSPWTVMTITRDEHGEIASTVSLEPLPEIRTTWHDRCVDVLSLNRTKRFRSGVQEVQCDDALAVAKIACLEWDIPRLERETWTYSMLAQDQQSHPSKPLISPNFLAHITEGERVIGILLQKVDGNPACIDDLAARETLLGRLHRSGLVHGDVNRYNFLVNEELEGDVRLVDFEHTEEFNDKLAREELWSLPRELAEETSRGASVVK